MSSAVAIVNCDKDRNVCSSFSPEYLVCSVDVPLQCLDILKQFDSFLSASHWVKISAAHHHFYFHSANEVSCCSADTIFLFCFSSPLRRLKQRLGGRCGIIKQVLMPIERKVQVYLHHLIQVTILQFCKVSPGFCTFFAHF